MRKRFWMGISSLFVGGGAALVACVGDTPAVNLDVDGGADGTVPTVDAGGGADAPISSGKICNGAQVATNDPSTGCANTSCAPCPAAANQKASCDPNGQCAAACNAGFADCDPTAPGCETPTTTDAKNCGACKHVCGTNANTTAATCTAGACAFTCTAPYAHCGMDDSLGCDTNLGVDPNNCAACAHSCQGGACVSGQCQSVLLAGNPQAYTGLKSLYGITVAGNQLFGTDWYQTNAGLVFKLPTAGVGDGGAVDWLVKAPVSTDGGVGGYADGGSAPCSASPIVNDGNGNILYGVFRQDSDGPAPGIWQISTTGSNNTPIVTLPNGANINAIAADSTYVYFSEFYKFGGANQYGIFRADRNTGANLGRYFYGTDNGAQGKIDTIYAEGGSVYWGDNATNTIWAAAPTALDTPVALATTVNAPGAVRTDAKYVYYYDNNKFYRVLKVGGAGTKPEDITPLPGLPVSVAFFLVDASYVYFFGPTGDLNTNNNQKLYAFPNPSAADGGAQSADAPFVIALIGSDNVSAVAQDTGAIYWTTYGRDSAPPPYSAIYKVAKPVAK